MQMKRKSPVAVMDTWPVRADGLLPVEKKPFFHTVFSSIANCKLYLLGLQKILFFFFFTLLSDKAEIAFY